MTVKKWRIVRQDPDIFTLSCGDTEIYFNDLDFDGVVWLAYRGKDLVAKLFRYANRIVNYADFPDGIEPQGADFQREEEPEFDLNEGEYPTLQGLQY